ncbi:MAG: lysophospholipid acyltransferase family protein, partial [Allosphingosinicella sp.]
MIRLVPRVLAMAGLLLLCLPLHYAWRMAGRRSPWPRRFLGGVGRAAGLRVRVEGRPLPSHVLFVGNHLSWLDIMALAGASGTAFVSKDDVARWPVAGWLARLNNTIFVARTERRAVKGQADALRAALAAGQPVALFPEGTTEGGHDVLPFRASLLAALFPPIPGVKVQPVALDYGEAAHDIAWVGKEGAAANAKRILARPGTIPLTVRFLAPVDPQAAGDRKALAESCRAEILEALDGPAPSAAFEAGA